MQYGWSRKLSKALSKPYWRAVNRIMAIIGLACQLSRGMLSHMKLLLGLTLTAATIAIGCVDSPSTDHPQIHSHGTEPSAHFRDGAPPLTPPLTPPSTPPLTPVPMVTKLVKETPPPKVEPTVVVYCVPYHGNGDVIFGVNTANVLAKYFETENGGLGKVSFFMAKGDHAGDVDFKSLLDPKVRLIHQDDPAAKAGLVFVAPATFAPRETNEEIYKRFGVDQTSVIALSEYAVSSCGDFNAAQCVHTGIGGRLAGVFQNVNVPNQLPAIATKLDADELHLLETGDYFFAYVAGNDRQRWTKQVGDYSAQMPAAIVVPGLRPSEDGAFYDGFMPRKVPWEYIDLAQEVRIKKSAPGSHDAKTLKIFGGSLTHDQFLYLRTYANQSC